VNDGSDDGGGDDEDGWGFLWGLGVGLCKHCVSSIPYLTQRSHLFTGLGYLVLPCHRAPVFAIVVIRLARMKCKRQRKLYHLCFDSCTRLLPSDYLRQPILVYIKPNNVSILSSHHRVKHAGFLTNELHITSHDSKRHDNRSQQRKSRPSCHHNLAPNSRSPQRTPPH